MAPEEPSPGWAFLVLAALVLAVTGFLAAPADWPSGTGSLAITLDDVGVAEVAVTWGSSAPVSAERTLGATTIVVELPDGARLDRPLQASLQVRRDGAPVRPDLQALTVRATLADGRVAPVPVVRWDPEGQVVEAGRQPASGAPVALGLLGLVVVFWVSGIVPLFVTSLLVPIVLVLGGVASATDALAPFFHPIIALFFAGFLMAEAMRRVGLDQRIARTLVARAGGGPRRLFATMLATSALLSMWMSNTAAVALLVPIALAVTAPLGSAGYQRATILGIAYAATAGGVGSAIGTPANLLAIEFLDASGQRQLTFLDWFAFGLPVLAVLLPLVGLRLWRHLGADVDPVAFAQAREQAKQQADVAAGRGLDGPQAQVVAVLVLVAGTWLSAGWHGLDTGIVALAGAVALALLGHVRSEDLGRISWASLLTFGGGLALGIFLTSTGVADWVAGGLGAVQGLPGPIAVAMVAVVALVMTTVASNTATAAMLIPLAIPIASVLGVDPTTLVVVVALASSVDFALVIGTPPTMLAWSTGLFQPSEILRAGAILDVLGVVVVVVVATVVWPLLGLV